MTAPRPRLFSLSLAAAVLALAWLYQAEAPLRSSIAFHHVASVRELARGELPPRHNLVAAYLPQGHYGPYLVLLGTLARWTGAEPLHVLQAAGLVNLIAFLSLFRWATARFVGEAATRWAVLAPLLLWGPWPGRVLEWSAWGWPGTTSLADPQNFFYPQQAGLVLTLLLLLLLTPARRPDHVSGATPPASARSLLGERLGGHLAAGRTLLALVVTAALIASHPLSGLALAPAIAALVVAEWRSLPRSPARILCLLGLLPAGLALAALWPYYPVLELLDTFVHPAFREPLPFGPPAAGALHGTAPANPLAPPLSVLGPALAGVPGCLLLALRGHPVLLLWSLADLALAALPVLPLRQRLLVSAATPLHLGATATLEWAWSRGRLARTLAIGLLAAGALSTATRARWVLAQEAPDLGFVARLTPEDAVFLADPRTSNAIAGLIGRKVVAPEGPDLSFLLAGGGQRVADVERFLRHGTTEPERTEILKRWRVSHVLIDSLGYGGPSLPYPVLYEGGGYRLYDVTAIGRP